MQIMSQTRTTTCTFLPCLIVSQTRPCLASHWHLIFHAIGGAQEKENKFHPNLGRSSSSLSSIYGRLCLLFSNSPPRLFNFLYLSLIFFFFSLYSKLSFFAIAYLATPLTLDRREASRQSYSPPSPVHPPQTREPASSIAHSILPLSDSHLASIEVVFQRWFHSNCPVPTPCTRQGSCRAHRPANILMR